MIKTTFIQTVILFLNSLNNYEQLRKSLPNRKINCSKVFKELIDKLESIYLGCKKLVEAEEESSYKNLKHQYSILPKELANNCTCMQQLFLNQLNDGRLFVFENPIYVYVDKEKAILQEREKRNQRNKEEVLEELIAQGHREYSSINDSFQNDLTEIGITTSFSKLLIDNKTPCNVIAGFYYDHIFNLRENTLLLH